MASTVNVGSVQSGAGSQVGAAVLPESAGRRLWLQIGAVTAVVGALLAFVTNGLHPHPTDFHIEAKLQQIALSGGSWGVLHLALIFALVIIFVALVAIALSLEDEPGATVARAGCVVALVGGTLMLVSTSIDGFAMNQLAYSWSSAPAAEQAAALRTAAAVDAAGWAVFSLSIALFLGAGIFLYGLATLAGDSYPKALGWLALLSSAGAFVVGIVQALGGPEQHGGELFFVLFSFLITAWVLVMGVLMWRKARAVAP